MSRLLTWKPKPPRLRLPKIHRSLGNHKKVHLDEEGRISYDTRLFVWTRDRGCCCHCGSTKNLQFDHVIPRALGGSGNAANTELLCQDCNLKKGARLFAPAITPYDYKRG